MNNNLPDNIRDKDAAILESIRTGEDDIQKITASTTLSNSEVNYSFQKLEDQGLIEVEKPDGMVERVINGTKQVFEAPKKAKLTDQGEQYLNQLEKDLDDFEDLNHDEAVEKIRELEQEVESLKSSFRVFKKQVKEQL
jgi:predicted transcriptional regulator